MNKIVFYYFRGLIIYDFLLFYTIYSMDIYVY